MAKFYLLELHLFPKKNKGNLSLSIKRARILALV